MVTLTWFESEQDLQALTGLSHDELWDAGFDLDDWDFGFVCNRDLNIRAYDKMEFDCGYFYLMKALCSFSGFKQTHTVYKGKHYYMSYTPKNSFKKGLDKIATTDIISGDNRSVLLPQHWRK